MVNSNPPWSFALIVPTLPEWSNLGNGNLERETVREQKFLSNSAGHLWPGAQGQRQKSFLLIAAPGVWLPLDIPVQLMGF
jgi:hypothetical protein